MLNPEVHFWSGMDKWVNKMAREISLRLKMGNLGIVSLIITYLQVKDSSQNIKLLYEKINNFTFKK